MDEYLGTSRHANNPDTEALRVLPCTKCGDRHTVDVTPINADAVSAYKKTLVVMFGKIIAAINERPIEPKYARVMAYRDGWRDAIEALMVDKEFADG